MALGGDLEQKLNKFLDLSLAKKLERSATFRKYTYTLTSGESITPQAIGNNLKIDTELASTSEVLSVNVYNKAGNSLLEIKQYPIGTAFTLEVEESKYVEITNNGASSVTFDLYTGDGVTTWANTIKVTSIDTVYSVNAAYLPHASMGVTQFSTGTANSTISSVVDPDFNVLVKSIYASVVITNQSGAGSIKLPMWRNSAYGYYFDSLNQVSTTLNIPASGGIAFQFRSSGIDDFVPAGQSYQFLIELEGGISADIMSSFKIDYQRTEKV